MAVLERGGWKPGAASYTGPMRAGDGGRAGGPGPVSAWACMALAWLAGCALQLQLPVLWPQAWTLAPLAAALVLALPGVIARRRWTGLVLLAAAALALGFGLTHLRAASRLADALPPALKGQDLVLTGRVASLPREGIDGVRFNFELESADRKSVV